MSHDTSANLQIFSPTGSGRTSPSPRATRNNTEEALQKKDKGFRRYAAGVDRALAVWDTAQQEWADYISFLGRLLKALQSHPPETLVIPHSDTVALRLAQCLNPTLPSGVHQKALEVYAYILSTIGKDALARDLNLYFPGLASVLSFASLSVRPLYLSIFEKYILKLDPSALRPALKAVILSLLPGLEDETSEDFERVISALDKLRDAVKGTADEASEKNDGGSSHFWQCFFLAAITNASRRQGALAYLVRRLPKFGISHRRSSVASVATTATVESLSTEAEAAISPEPGLLIRCFESGLLDAQLLIQRGFLDLLVSHLPLDSPVLQQRISGEDLERLVAAAASVVSRRDMSLNRRLWAWFLGPEPPGGAERNESLSSPRPDQPTLTDPSAYHAAYFSHNGLHALTQSVLKAIQRPSKLPSERAKPFRLCLSLMDRWEVGGLIVPEVFLPALQSIQSYSESATKEEIDEVMRSASTFFDGVDSGLIWGKLTQLVTSSLSPPDTSRGAAVRKMKLAKFVLARFNLKEEDMLLHHMPLMVLSTLSTLNNICEKAAGANALEVEVLDVALEIADSLIQIIPGRAITDQLAPATDVDAAAAIPRETTFRKIQEFYEESQGSLDVADPPFTAVELGQLLLRESACLFGISIGNKTNPLSPDMPSRILSNVIFKVQHLTALDEVDPFAIIHQVLSGSTDESTLQLSFAHYSALTTVLCALQTTSLHEPYIMASQIPELVHPLVASLWHHLSPLMPKYHVEAVRCILQLHTIAPHRRMVEAAIASIIANQSPQPTASRNGADVGQRFAVLWTHTMYEVSLQSEKRGSLSRRSSGMGASSSASHAFDSYSIIVRPLLLLLDSLGEEATVMSAFTRTWLQDLPSLNKVFEILAIHLQSLDCMLSNDSLVPGQKLPSSKGQTRANDTKDCLYYLKHIHNILKQPSHYTWVTLAEEAAPQTWGSPSKVPLQEWLINSCMRALSIDLKEAESTPSSHLHELYRISVEIITQLYRSPFAPALKTLELEVPLMARLRSVCPTLQSLLLGAVLSALKIRLIQSSEEQTAEQKPPFQPGHRSRLSIATTRDSEDAGTAPVPPPPQLVEILKYGFSSSLSHLVLDDWVHFLVEVLPMFADTIFQNLLPLVECLCKQITQTFEQMKAVFASSTTLADISPETTLVSLINGLEQILAKAHDRLMQQETKTAVHKSPEQPQGFFGNMVSGVFSSESNQTRTPTANSRLTVLLCFQDTVRICFAIWSWGYGPTDGRQDAASASSFGYTSLRMRNRARRILEHLFAAEALECLETLAVLWAQSSKDDLQATAIMGLLNVLNGSKPKHTIPAIFNAVYSRTNPNALDPHRMSTLTSDLADTDLVAFLVDYTKSLEDDAMDEIWLDCTLFLRDVLANPLPHRQILPSLLEFTAVIGQKIDNTNFGEQRKTRKELADLFQRLLTAIFTTRSMGFLQDPSQVMAAEKISMNTNSGLGHKRANDVVFILNMIVPSLPIILVDNDRVANVATSISTSVIGPTFRAKAFPDNITKGILDLLQGIAKVSPTNKFWKKDLSDAFNDPKFFGTPLPLLRESWLPIIAQWTYSDKDRLPELLSRISAPTTAGIMFGVGAASARQEADRKTQLTLRRIALLILGSPEDAFTPSIPAILEKVVDLLTATPASSPSSITRTEVFILLRSLILKTSSIHLASLWPIINSELTSSLSSLLPDAYNKEHYNNAGIVQACKLLDELVVLDPDDFQLIEWLYISDTIDAVYKPANMMYPTSLTDEISEVLQYTQTHAGSLTDVTTSRRHRSSVSHSLPANNSSSASVAEPKRSLFLDPLISALEKEEGAGVTVMARRELVDRVVRPFLGSLAMSVFEATYEGGQVDWEGVWKSVVADARGLE